MARVGNTGQSRKTIQASDLQDKALGVGRPGSSDKSAGKARARWAQVNLTGGGAVAGTTVEYDVPHDLGGVPVLCELKSFENAGVPATFIAAAESRKAHWSRTHCHMNLRLVAGSFDGCVAHFLVQGE